MDTLTKMDAIKKHEAPLRLAFERSIFHNGFRMFQGGITLAISRGLRDVKTVFGDIKFDLLSVMDRDLLITDRWS